MHTLHHSSIQLKQSWYKKISLQDLCLFIVHSYLYWHSKHNQVGVITSVTTYLPYSGFISLLDRLVCYMTCLQKSIHFYHVQILCSHANRKAFYWIFPSPLVIINLYCTVTLASLLHKSILLICVVMPWWAYFLSTLLLSTQGNLNSCFPRPLWTYNIPLAHELSLYKKVS